MMQIMKNDGIMMWKLKGQMDKGGHYNVDGWKRWHYDMEIKKGNGEGSAL